MSKLKQINDDLKVAMREKNREVLQTLRAVKAAVTNFEKAGKGEVDDIKVIDILKKQVKQRRDSIESFNGANRPDLVEKEQVELDILTEYLPEQMSEDEVRTNILTIIDTLGATSVKDMGKVMGTCKSAFDGKADNSLVAKIVKEELTK